MGTWGVGPFDNDDAADMTAGLMEDVRRVADDRRGANYNKARAAAQFVIAAHGTDILGGPNLGQLVIALAKMRKDHVWLANWEEPKKIASALDVELQIIIDRIFACKGCRKSIPISELRALKVIVEEARKNSVPKSTRPKRAAIPVGPYPRRSTRAAVRKLLKAKAPA